MRERRTCQDRREGMYRWRAGCPPGCSSSPRIGPACRIPGRWKYLSRAGLLHSSTGFLPWSAAQRLWSRRSQSGRTRTGQQRSARTCRSPLTLLTPCPKTRVAADFARRGGYLGRITGCGCCPIGVWTFFEMPIFTPL